MMATTASDPGRFVRSTSLTFALYSLGIMISCMTMLNSANAVGTVAPSAPLWCSNPSFSSTCVYPTKEEACIALIGNRTDVYYGFLYYYPGGEAPGWTCWAYNATYSGNLTYAGRFGWIGSMAVCPANSTGTTTCTCNAGFEPDSTATSCVAENSCPANMSGSPCACNAGYELGPSGAGCTLAQYTLSLTTDPPDEVAPSGTATVIATVEKSVGGQTSPKSDVLVNIKVDVEAGSGGHDHDDGRHVSPYTGTLDRATGTTSSEGKVGFTFGAPKVSGTHTITVACVNLACTNNPQTIKINVKVDGLLPIPGSPYYALQDSAGNLIGAIMNKHTDNHYLTRAAIKELKAFAQAYQEIVNRGERLYLNDASLVWGGLFDVGGTPWTSPHKGHNRGMSIDIRAENSGPNNEGAVPSILFDDTLKVAAKNHIRAALHCKDSSNTTYCLGVPNNRHFHVDF